MNFFNSKIFYRNIKRDKLISIINAVGLITGILSALFILEYVYYQRSYDSHHKNGKDIYRVAYNRYQNNKELWKTANSFYPTGKWMKDHYNVVKNHARITPKHNNTISCKDVSGSKVFYTEAKAFYATASMFDMFTIPILQGKKEALEAPFTVAISQDAAKRYFGERNALGEILNVNGKEHFTVVVVYESMPSNTILKSDFLFSMETIYKQSPRLRNNWGNDYGITFLQLKAGSDFKKLEQEGFPKMIEANYKKVLDAENKVDRYYLQPLQGIHLNSNIEYETAPPVNGKIITILFGFSIFLFLIAWINFINLTTAKSIERANEVGIKKISGATKRQLISQFLGEAFLFNLHCLVITFFLFYALNPVFKDIIEIGTFSLFEYPNFWSFFGIIFCLGIIISCVYPAIVLQSYEPMMVLKGKFKNKREGVFFRKFLVTLQFTISFILLCGTFIAYRQATFLMEKDMGIDYTQSIVISAPRTGEKHKELNQKILLLQDEITQLPEVGQFTFSSDIPGREIEHWFSCRRKGYDLGDRNVYFQLSVDDQFMDFYNVKLLAGRSFRKGEKEHANKSLIMNLKAIERLGYETPQAAIGTYIIGPKKQEFRIVGVVDNFYYKSIKNEPVPTVLRLTDRHKSFLTIKVKDDETTGKTVVRKLKAIYSRYFPDQPFDYTILENEIKKDLKPDQTFLFVFGLFSILAILIAVIGVVGLILITINHRMKEIGIRKVLGARLIDVSTLLSKEVAYQIGIAILIAIPLAWYGYEKWFLSTYIDSIELHVWMFLCPVIILFLIILLVIHLVVVRAYSVTLSEVLQNQ